MDALKTIIKSIAISYPAHLTVDQLQRDYREIEGRVLPYRNLGYESLHQMLRCAFGDVIKVYGEGPKAFVVPVKNDKSEHIIRLVNEQRTAKNMRHLARSHYKIKKYGHFHSFARHDQNRNICLTRSTSKCLYNNHNIKNFQSMSSVKEEVMIEKNEESYKPSIVQSGDSQNSIDSRAISLDIQLRYQKEVAENQIKNSVSSTSTGNEDNKYECDEVAVTNLESYPVHDLEEAISDLNISGVSVTDITKKYDDLASLDSCSGHFNSYKRHDQNRNICLTRSTSKCLYNSHNIKNFQSMSSVKEEVMNEKNEESYKPSIVQSGDSQNSIDSRAISLDIQLRYQKEVAENQIKNSVSSTSTGNEDNKYECDEVAATNLESYPVHDLEEAISDLNISGVSVIDITKKDDDLASLDSCSDIFFKPKKNRNNSEFDEAIPDFALNSRIFLLDFPELTVKFGTKIKPFEMPQNITVDSVISIYIGEVHNPYRFWFQQSGQSNVLDELMNTIEHFYQPMDQTLKYNILPEQIQAGQVCATKFNGFWHRAEILQNYVIDNKVKVFFMDYGTVFDVEICNIKYLCTEFAKLPAFALRGCLAEISPLSLHWSISSSLAFLSMCCERLVHAKVREIDSVNKVYYLIVCDTHDERVVQINRELIDLNHALKNWEWYISRRLDRPRLRHKREDYPTFDMLENGDYPTLSELIDMESKGIYYESLTDKKINHPRILNFEKQTAELLRDLPFLLLSNNPFASDIIEELNETVSNNENQKTKLKC